MTFRTAYLCFTFALALVGFGCSNPSSAVDPDVPDAAPVDAGPLDADTSDDDGDGVPDVADSCPGLDDRIDINANSVADCTENLLGNGQFATDVTPWLPTPPTARATIAFATTDGTGSSRSGSGRVVNVVAETSANAGDVVSECIDIVPGTGYRLYARYLKPAGQPGGDAAAAVSFAAYTYKDNNCTMASSSVTPPGAGTVTAAWTVHADTLPAGALANAESLRVSLTVRKGATAQPVEATFDDVLMIAE